MPTTPDKNAPRCAGCGYSLAGLPDRAGAIVCPECGATNESNESRRRREELRLRKPLPAEGETAGAFALFVLTFASWPFHLAAMLTVARGGSTAVALSAVASIVSGFLVLAVAMWLWRSRWARTSNLVLSSVAVSAALLPLQLAVLLLAIE